MSDIENDFGSFDFNFLIISNQYISNLFFISIFDQNSFSKNIAAISSIFPNIFFVF